MKIRFALPLIILLIALFCFYKPIYLSLLFVLFSYENFIFINLIFSYKKAIKLENYAYFSVAALNAEDRLSYKIWLKINELRAFNRFYRIISSKKFNVKTLIATVVIIAAGFPIKLCELVFFLVKRNTSLYESLRYLYFVEFYSVQNKKIEVIYRNTYINVVTRKDVINIIINRNPIATKHEVANIYHRLVTTNNRFMRGNPAQQQTMESFKLGKLMLEESIKVKVPHWTNETTWKVKGDRLVCAIHATSNMPDAIADSQERGAPMVNLIKGNAQKPGSIITHGGYTFNPIKFDIKHIPAWQLHYVMYDVYKDDVHTPFKTLFEEREDEIKAILGPKASRDEIIAFTACSYDTVLAADFGKNVDQLLDEIGVDFN